MLRHTGAWCALVAMILGLSAAPSPAQWLNEQEPIASDATAGAAANGQSELLNRSDDCNDNGIPDERDIEDGTSRDCNTNASLDECDIADGTSRDDNHDGVPDECEITEYVTFDPADARGIRDFHFGGGSFLLTFLAIKHGTEDRTVLEFDVGDLVASLGTRMPRTTLDLGLSNLDPDPPEGIIDIFPFPGDGVVTADEFYAGGPTPFASFVGVDGLSRIDVTSALQSAVDAGYPFLGFRLSSETLDRFWVGRISGQPEPVLRAVVVSDCNSNGMPDEEDIATGTSKDCNENATPDECDIADGSLPDDNGNGVPDECEISAHLDIRPGSCPNPVNPRSRGVVPVVLAGSLDLDVAEIDSNSLTLTRADGAGTRVSPLLGRGGHGIVIRDVVTAFAGDLCACNEVDRDGIDDLALKFSTSDMNRAFQLNHLPRGTTIELVLRGTLKDGTPFEAFDCIRVPGTARNSIGRRRTRRP